MTEDHGWTLDLIDDDLEIPGWLFVPQGLGRADQERWVRSAQDELADVPAWDGPPPDPALLREMLVHALELREQSESLAVLQVWPALANATAMGHVDVLPSDALWDWTRTDAVVHRIDEPHIGPGLQISTRRTVTLDDIDMDVSSTAFSFDNGEVTLMVAVAETLTPLLTFALPGLLALMRNIRLVDTRNGSAFTSIEPTGVLTEPDWALDGSS